MSVPKTLLLIPDSAEQDFLKTQTLEFNIPNFSPSSTKFTISFLYTLKYNVNIPFLYSVKIQHSINQKISMAVRSNGTKATEMYYNVTFSRWFPFL